MRTAQQAQQDRELHETNRRFFATLRLAKTDGLSLEEAIAQRQLNEEAR